MNKYSGNSKLLMWTTALVFAGAMAGCGGGGGSGSSAGSNAGGTNPALTVAAGAGTGLNGAGVGPAPINLGMAGNYAILAEALISTTTTAGTAITGDLGMSPAAATFIQGFSLTLDGTGCFSTPTPATLVTGKVYAADYNTGGCPTPTNLGTAVLNKGAAFTDGNSRAPDYTELGAGNIGGMTLPPAVYKWSGGVSIPSDLVLAGGPNDVWIFQVTTDVTVASNVRVTLTGGALAKNIFWVTGGVADFETTSHFEGIVLSASAITLKTGASLNGRLLAHTNVTLDSNVVVQPAP
jgi:hypothetical protein